MTSIGSNDISRPHIDHQQISNSWGSIEDAWINFRENNFIETTVCCCSHLWSNFLFFDVIDINIGIHGATNTVWSFWSFAECNALNTIRMNSKLSPNFTCLVVWIAHYTLKVSWNTKRLFMVKSKSVNWVLMENYACVLLPDHIHTIILHWWPNSNSFISTTTDNKLSSIRGELGCEYLFLMTTERSQKISCSSIHEPYHVIFASADNCITFWMPFTKEDVISFCWSILKLALYCILHIIAHSPDSKDIVHSSCN